MSFTAIVTCHANEDGLRRVLGNLIYQTNPPDEIIAYCSDIGLMRLREDFPDIEFVQVENRNDWGHEKRAQGVEAATQEWLGFFNDDDQYTNDYLERMLAAGENAEVVYCAWNEQPECHFAYGSSTSGNFIVKTELARKAGYENRGYAADGEFIEAVARIADGVVRVDDVLYTHN